MTLLPHLAARLFGVPLLIHRAKLDTILAVLGPRIGLIDPTTLAGFTPPARINSSSPSNIAVIPIHGTLVRRSAGLDALSGLTSYADIGAQIDAAVADPRVAAILLDIDSPGGEAGGVFDLAERIRTASQSKPVWAVANDAAFSAAYALAAGAQRLYVSRTGGVGSIGVIAMHVDQSMRDAQAGLRYTAVYAGAHKADMSPHAPLSDAAQAALQSEVDRIYGLFTASVAAHRGLSVEVVRATEAGLFFGPDAVAAGLADALGGIDQALAELATSLKPALSFAPARSSTSAGNLLYPTKEALMNDPTHAAPVAGSVPAGALPPVPSVLAPAASAPPTPVLTAACAVEIAQLCALAGRTDLTAGFLEAGVSPAAARSQLLAARAQTPEIASRISPDAAAHHAARAADPASPDNPLIQAVKRRLGTA